MMGIYNTTNSILSSIINRTNIFGIGKSFDHMHEFSGLKLDEYTVAEFLNGMRVVLNSIFRGGKVISIRGTEDGEDVRITINPIIYDEKNKKSKESNEPVSFTYKRNAFSELKIKRNYNW